MRFDRSCGLLLHISSLPGEYGIGDVGPVARGFVDFLRDAGQSWWQILPLGPSDDGCPYIAQSSWAGAPVLVSLDDLVEAGDLRLDELAGARVEHADRIDYGRVSAVRADLLTRAAERFFGRTPDSARQRFEHFAEAEASWLDDWALYAAARRHHDARPWWEWPRELALRERDAVSGWSRRLDGAMRIARYTQFRFFEQWDRLRAHARDAGVGLIGDLPIYTARDSADVWSARDRFLLDADGRPTVVSGVPPDYFAADGQLWGTPLYDWDRHRAEAFAWWIERLRGSLRLVDVLRVDHFRAFESYWEVPADAATAREGRWLPGPRDAFFEAVRDALGSAPLIAEDLGLITRAVQDLRDRWELPGMRVLQFGFGQDATSPHLPVYHDRRCVAYTGTHDNDTTVGWYQVAPEDVKDHFRRFTSSDGSAPHYHMILAAYRSVADLAVTTAQDALGLGSDARMNTPGVSSGNWLWKLVPWQLDGHTAGMLRNLAGTCGRLPWQREAELLVEP